MLDAINTDAQVTRMWQRVSRRTVGQSHFRVGSGRAMAETEAALLGGGRGWWGKETSTPFPVSEIGFVGRPGQPPLRRLHGRCILEKSQNQRRPGGEPRRRSWEHKELC